jgi:hypothetical protein
MHFKHVAYFIILFFNTIKALVKQIWLYAKTMSGIINLDADCSTEDDIMRIF